jgi:hypothetical protein
MLLQRINELERENKKAMETIGLLAIRVVGLTRMEEESIIEEDEERPELIGFDELGRRIISGEEKIETYLERADKVRELDEIRKLKRQEEKRSRPLDRSGPLPKPLFERQSSDVCDIHYLDRHPETPLELAEILRRQNRMTIDELSTDDISKAVELFEEPIMPNQRDALLEGLGRYLEQIQRERSGSEGDTDLLAKKRMPR